MRTMIHIDNHLFAELKRIAAEMGRTPPAVIQDALRESISRRRKADRVVLPAPNTRPRLFR